MMNEVGRITFWEGPRGIKRGEQKTDMTKTNCMHIKFSSNF